MDVHTPEQRRRNMAAIKSKDTRPEILLRAGIHSHGYRFVVHGNSLPGRPDVVFTRRKKAIFVDGCFWHSHDCKWGRVAPATNAEFWRNKRGATVVRDALKRVELEALGWQVLTVWECELRHPDAVFHRVEDFLGSPRAKRSTLTHSTTP